MAEPRTAVLLRLDPALKARLFEQAKRNDRTVNAEATRIFRANLEQVEQAPLVEAR